MKRGVMSKYIESGEREGVTWALYCEYNGGVLHFYAVANVGGEHRYDYFDDINSARVWIQRQSGE